MSTTLTYNRVQLKRVRTIRFDESAAYDESDTDLTHHKFQIRVESLCHVNTADRIAAVPVGGTPTTAAQAVAALHSQLMHPRGDFAYRIGNFNLLIATAKSKSVDRDVANGPKPRECNITHIAGTRLLRIEYEIEINVVKCGGANQSPSQVGQPAANVLNNRWSLEDTSDEDFYFTRTWSGTLRVAHHDFSPQLYRNLVTPPLQRGYRRHNQRFLTSPDGLTLKYQIADKQIHAAAPAPATTWRGHYTEATGSGGGKGHAEIEVSLTGAPGSDKRDLITAGVQVVESRLGDLRKAFGSNPSGIVLQQAAITEHFAENRVDVRVRALRTATAKKYLNLVSEHIGKFLDEGVVPIPNYDHEVSIRPITYDGRSPSHVFAMYLQTPCDDRHGIPQPNTISPEGDEPVDYDESGEPVIYEISEEIPDDNASNLSRAQQDYFYTFVEARSEYSTQTGKVCLPTDGLPTFVNLFGAKTNRVFTITAERVSRYPETPMPLPVLQDPNGIFEHLLDWDFTPFAPELMPDGASRLHRIEARFVYALSAPVNRLSIYRSGANLIDRALAGDNVFTGALHFVRGIQ